MEEVKNLEKFNYTQEFSLQNKEEGLVGMEGPTVFKLGNKISSVTNTKTMKFYNREERVNKSGVGILKENGCDLVGQLDPVQRLEICSIYKYFKELGGSTSRETSVIEKIQTLARFFAPVQQIEQGDNIVKTGSREHSISEAYKKELGKA
ncbi:24084_t:CDS:2 [Gigaspora margarita]|uniref:24084_t:CDS:1 n=1 Tax=Gigaspora margarita TaxID=4874 RepID=A0ABN7VWF5_GIGMA|nr:24084_t:CDS:2 [Gigaspora margarita]